MIKVSVVIPSYNHEKYIEAAVQSVLQQSEQDIELIVVDDGSSDASLVYLRSVKDSRFILVEQKNAGAHNAINRGLSIARGDYLAILNSDDVFHPDRLKRCVEFLERNRGDLVSTWIDVVKEDGAVVGVKKAWLNMLPWSVPDQPNSFAATDDFALNLIISNFVSTTSNMLFTRALYERVGGMRNLRFAHDWDFLFRAVKEHKCLVLPEPLMSYRIHGTNTISSNRAWMLFEICWVLAVGLEMLWGKKILKADDAAHWQADVRGVANSVNLQGNDKVFWMIRNFIDALRSQGVDAPELILLDDEQLRSVFVTEVNIDERSVEPVNVSDGLGIKALFRLLIKKVVERLQLALRLN